MNPQQAGGHMTDPTYALGRSDDEYARLTEQANFLRPLTERFFRRAGITSGMKVLDVGSGVGDVAFLLAELVGRDGKIVGVDMRVGLRWFPQNYYPPTERPTDYKEFRKALGSSGE